MRVGDHPLRPPKGMNPAAIELWLSAFDGSEHPVRRFEELCYTNNVEPYTHSRVGNADVQAFLRARRRAVVRFLNLTGLHDQTKTIRWPTRSVEMYPGGFRLSVQAQVRADPTFALWLRKNIKLPYRVKALRENRRMIVALDHATKFFVFNTMITEANRWFIGYTIDCPMVPALKNAVPDDQYILQQIWLPIARARRPQTVRPLQI